MCTTGALPAAGGKEINEGKFEDDTNTILVQMRLPHTVSDTESNLADVTA